MPEVLATFQGVVSCTRAATARGFALSGLTAERPGEPTTLTFSAAAPADLPTTLEDARVERVGGGAYCIAAAAGSWQFEARAAELQREVAVPFFRALPPRPVPWSKRVFWSLVLALASSRAGLALLRRLRR